MPTPESIIAKEKARRGNARRLAGQPKMTPKSATKPKRRKKAKPQKLGDEAGRALKAGKRKRRNKRIAKGGMTARDLLDMMGI